MSLYKTNNLKNTNYKIPYRYPDQVALPNPCVRYATHTLVALHFCISENYSQIMVTANAFNTLDHSNLQAIVCMSHSLHNSSSWALQVDWAWDQCCDALLLPYFSPSRHGLTTLRATTGLRECLKRSWCPNKPSRCTIIKVLPTIKLQMSRQTLKDHMGMHPWFQEELAEYQIKTLRGRWSSEQIDKNDKNMDLFTKDNSFFGWVRFSNMYSPRRTLKRTPKNGVCEGGLGV